MALPANISTGRVTGQFIVGVADGADVDDEPDFIAASGTIAFTASTPYLPNPTASPNPVTMLKTTILAVLDGEGYICTPTPGDPTVAGKRGIRLVATDDKDASVEGWTWKATPQFLNVNGTVIHDAIKTFDFALPSGATVDLTTVVKVPASQGIGTEQAEALAAAASASAQAAAADAAAVKDKALANDAGVAGFLTSGAKTTVALDSKVKESTSQQVPPLVAQAIAADGTLVAAAESAVGGAVLGLELAQTLTGTDAGDIAGGMVDGIGRATWLTHNDTGGPTEYALSRLGISHAGGPEAVGGMVDSEGNITWLTHDQSGGPTAYAIERLRDVLGGDSGPTPAPTAGNRRAMLGNELRLMNGGTIRTKGAAPVVMIFDHGLNNFRDIILPLLKARGLPAVMALNGDLHKAGHVIEAESAAVTWEEINAWDSSIEIANHGASHSTRIFTDSEIEAEVVGSLAELRSKLPAKKILNWVQPSAKFPGFDDGLTTANWTSTVAGQVILEHHAVATGMIKTPEHPLIPRDGNILQGVTGTWLDGPGGMAGAKAQVQSATTAGKGIILRHHPRHLDGAGYATTAALTSLLDFLKAEQDAGRVKVMTLSQWSIADTGI